MIILGIDPGDTLIGYGVVEEKRGVLRLIDSGCIAISSKNKTAPQKLVELEEKLGAIVGRHRPAHAGVEELFFFKNAKTAIRVAQARGVILATLQKNGVSVIECTPLQIKQAVTGYGRAEKKQVQRMLSLILNLEKPIKQDDAADAVAAALCAHALSKTAHYH